MQYNSGHGSSPPLHPYSQSGGGSASASGLSAPSQKSPSNARPSSPLCALVRVDGGVSPSASVPRGGQSSAYVPKRKLREAGVSFPELPNARGGGGGGGGANNSTDHRSPSFYGARTGGEGGTPSTSASGSPAGMPLLSPSATMGTSQADLLGFASKAHVSNTTNTDVTHPHVIDDNQFGRNPIGGHSYGYSSLVSPSSSASKRPQKRSIDHFFGSCHIPLNVGVMFNILITVTLVAILSIFPLNAVSIRSMEHVTTTLSTSLANTLAESINANLYFLPFTVKSFAAAWLTDRVTPKWQWSNLDMPDVMQQMCNTASFSRATSHLLYLSMSSPVSGYLAYCSPQYSNNFLIGKYVVNNESSYRYLIDSTFGYATPLTPYLPVKKMTPWEEVVSFGGEFSPYERIAKPWYEKRIAEDDDDDEEEKENTANRSEDGWDVSKFGNVSVVTYTIPFIDYKGNLGLISAGLQPSGISSVFPDGVLSSDVGKAMVVDPQTGMVLVNSWGESTHVTVDNWDEEKMAEEGFKASEGLYLHEITDTLMKSALRNLGGQEGLATKPREVTRWQSRFTDAEGEALALATRIMDETGKLNLIVIYAVSKSDYTANIGTVRVAVIISVVVILVIIAFIDLLLVYLFLQPLRGVAAGLHEASQLKDGSGSVEGRISVIKEVAEMQYHFKIMNAQLMRMKAFLPQGVLGPLSAWSGSDSRRGSEFGDSYQEGYNSDNNSDADGPSAGGVGRHQADGGNLHLNERVLLDEVNKFRRRYCTILCLVLHVREVDAPVPIIDSLVSNFMESAIPSILSFGGVIEVQRPDYIVVSFGSHSRLPMHQTRAAKCALEIMGVVNYNRSVGQRVGCMLDVGEYYVGTCGAAQRHARVTYGIRMPMMSDLVKLCKSLDSQILVTQRMASALDEHMLTVPVDSIIYTMGSKYTILYELRGSSKWLPPCVSEVEVRTMIRQIRLAFTRMINGDYVSAIRYLEPYENKDKQVTRLARACRALAAKKITKPFVRTIGRIKLTDADIVYEEDAQRFSLQNDPFMQRGATSTPGYDMDPSHQQNVGGLPTGPPASTARLIEGVTVDDTGDDDENGGDNALFEMFIEADDDDDDTNEMQSTTNADVPQDSALTSVSSSRPLVSAAKEGGGGGKRITAGELPTTFVDFEGNEWTRSADRLGEGAFSVVYRGLSRTGNLVALKCFQLRARNIDASAITEEIRVFASLHHENIVQYVGAYVSDFYIIEIMELVPGGSLDTMLTSFGQLTNESVRRYLRDILRGLGYLHSMNIVHCDIKPHNVLLAMDGQCKLSDFGSAMAKATGSVGKIDDVLDMRGTPGYMAPEVARGDIPTMSSDIFSLGVTILELLTGRLPWDYIEGQSASRRPSLSNMDVTESGGGASPLVEDLQFAHQADENNHRRPIDQVLRNATQLIIHISRGLVMPVIPGSFDEDLTDFLEQCLFIDPSKRASADELMNHPWLM